MQTHEDYIRAIAAFAVMHADLNPSEQATLEAIKLVYGSGPAGTRGVTFYQRWNAGGELPAVPFVEVSAFGQSSNIQLAGTTIHELGHVLAGFTAGHEKAWHEACERLGLVDIKAAGTDYKPENFAPWLWSFIETLEVPTDGQPVKHLSMPTAAMPGMPFGFRLGKMKGCQAGIGTRGGKSRGSGSGSRLRLFVCQCHGKGKQLASPVKVRIAADVFDAVHKPCGKPFKRS